MKHMMGRLCLGIWLVLAFNIGFCAAQGVESESFYASDKIHEIKIELAAADWKTLKGQQPNGATFTGGDGSESNYTYFEGTIWINGQEVPNVGIRKKGFFGSNDLTRPSLKVKFDEYQKQEPLPGIDLLTLNNNKQDQSLMSQYLAYQVFRKAGLHAPRSNFVRLTVNNKYLGVYSNVESVKKPFLKREFGNSDGALYEGALADFHPIGSKNIEAKNKAAEDRRKLEELSALLAKPGDLPLDQVDALIDLDYFIRYWVVEDLLGFWDGYAANQNNYYLYFNSQNGKGYFVPWGVDWVFTRSGPFAMFGTPPPLVNAQSILANRLYRTEGIPERYAQAMRQVLDEAWDDAELLATIDRMETTLKPYFGGTQQETESAMKEVREFIRQRKEFVNNELAKGPAKVPDQPRSPAYLVAVGAISGEFETTWGPSRPGEEMGTANIEATLDGEMVKFEQVSVSAGDFQPPRFGGGFGGGFGGPPVDSVHVTVVGKRGDQPSLMLSLTFPKEKVTLGTPIKVTGQLTEIPIGGPGNGPPPGGGFGPGGFGNLQSLQGTLEFTAVEMIEGNRVAGTLKLDVNKTKGGLFGGGGFGGPNRNGPPRNGPPISGPPRE
ncbi:MAG: CotH kinase family protein [Planctomycetaceae bacterium]|nr:CotH kinase family protein [Planctomycetaceae bacterium]